MIQQSIPYITLHKYQQYDNKQKRIMSFIEPIRNQDRLCQAQITSKQPVLQELYQLEYNQFSSQETMASECPEIAERTQKVEGLTNMLIQLEIDGGNTHSPEFQKIINSLSAIDSNYQVLKDKLIQTIPKEQTQPLEQACRQYEAQRKKFRLLENKLRNKQNIKEKNEVDFSKTQKVEKTKQNLPNILNQKLRKVQKEENDQFFDEETEIVQEPEVSKETEIVQETAEGSEEQEQREQQDPVQSWIKLHQKYLCSKLNSPFKRLPRNN